jgi:23S rRNA (adenine2503-C2)-methyltransferase
LQDLVLSLGEPSYRADQVYRWLYQSLAASFEEMQNLPRPMRRRLEQMAHLQSLVPVDESRSSSGLTRKVLFTLPDGETIETVLMLYDSRQTVCVSTQVGCPLGCPFCATGQSGFARNLTAGEIVGQVLYFARQLKEDGQSVSNVVFMGMGEPLLNYDATRQAVETLIDPRGYNLGARRITISTAGIVPGIQRLGEEGLQVGLAVSLHAPSDDLRETLVPVARRYPLRDLLSACRSYVKLTGRRVTFEYALVNDLNDSPQQARQLAHLLSRLLCHVNLIPLNPTADCPWRPSDKDRVEAFHLELRRLGINSTLRLRRGIDIEAGCGQLRSRHPAVNRAKALDGGSPANNCGHRNRPTRRSQEGQSAAGAVRHRPAGRCFRPPARD